MKGLTANEAAFLFCVIGEPGGIYPSVDEAIRYFNPPKYSKKKEKKLPHLEVFVLSETTEEEKAEQLSLFQEMRFG